MNTALVIAHLWALSLAAGPVAFQQDVSDAEIVDGLLRGVRVAREGIDPIRAELKIVQNQPGLPKPKDFTLFCLVEQSGDQRRFEILPTSDYTQMVYLYKGLDLYAFRNSRAADIDVYDMKRAVGVRGDFCFDPRVLGLSDLLAANHTITVCLGIEDQGTSKVVSRKNERDKTFWTIRKRVTGAFDRTIEWVIEEPGYRVHRKTIEWEGSKSEVKSRFASPDAPFPDEVQIYRTSGGRVERDMKVTIESFKESPIPKERLELSSISMPVNTMVNDYRINRIAGYWDGTKIVPDPVQPSRPKDGEPKK